MQQNILFINENKLKKDSSKNFLLQNKKFLTKHKILEDKKNHNIKDFFNKSGVGNFYNTKNENYKPNSDLVCNSSAKEENSTDDSDKIYNKELRAETPLDCLELESDEKIKFHFSLEDLDYQAGSLTSVKSKFMSHVKNLKSNKDIERDYDNEEINNTLNTQISVPATTQETSYLKKSDFKNPDSNDNENNLLFYKKKKNRQEQVLQDDYTDHSYNDANRNMTITNEDTPYKSFNVAPRLYDIFVFKNKKLIEQEAEQENEQQATDKPQEKVLIRKRLIKKIEAIKKRKETEILKTQFFDLEAELGSDNESHDERVKNINSNLNDQIEEEENLLEIDMELKKDLESMIDDSLAEDQLDNEAIKEKFKKDMLLDDKQAIKEVIKGPRKVYETSKTNDKPSCKHFEDYDENLDDENYVSLYDRILKQQNYFISKEENNNAESGKKDYFKSLFTRTALNRIKFKKDFEQNLGAEEVNDEEFQRMLDEQELNSIKLFAEKTNLHMKSLKEKYKENSKILESVINLTDGKNNSLVGNKNTELIGNSTSTPFSNLNYSNDSNNNNYNNNNNTDKSNLGSTIAIKTGYILKGNMKSDENKRAEKMNLLRLNPLLGYKLGNFYDCRNSFLYAMKNDKYFAYSDKMYDDKDKYTAFKHTEDKVKSFSSNINSFFYHNKSNISNNNNKSVINFPSNAEKEISIGEANKDLLESKKSNPVLPDAILNKRQSDNFNNFKKCFNT